MRAPHDPDPHPKTGDHDEMHVHVFQYDVQYLQLLDSCGCHYQVSPTPAGLCFTLGAASLYKLWLSYAPPNISPTNPPNEKIGVFVTD